MLYEEKTSAICLQECEQPKFRLDSSKFHAIVYTIEMMA